MIIDSIIPSMLTIVILAIVFFVIIPICMLIIAIINSREKKWKKPKIKDGKLTKYGWVVRHPRHLTLGENTDIGFGTYIQAKNGVHIGNNVKIGSHCSIYSENTIEDTSCTIFIKDNAKIGAGTVITPEKGKCLLTIEQNCVVGAMSLVREDVIPANTKWYGIPATKRGIV